MKLKVSSVKLGDLSPSDCINDPEEKEISDDDDDDRNHKHRRRDTRSQSSERDALEQVLTRPYRKRYKPLENGHPFRENESQASETWRRYNISPLDKDFSVKFDKRRPGLASFPRAHLDLNQRIRANHTIYGDTGSGRGRGRDSGSWNQRDSRISSVDIASQIVTQGSIPPSMFAGRGLPNVSNAQSASWSPFGLIPGLPNGGMDTLRSIGLQGTLRPAINPSLNMGIPRQRCRDFEERGFCLRGDMCPMEHGVNRIVVEDVQSLSQFNLPVSLPSAHLLGTHAGPGSVPSVSAPSTTLMNSKGLHNKSSKPGMVDDGLGLNGAFSGSASASGADLYDPDQPLWNNNCPETSAALLGLHSPKIDETEPLLNEDFSDHHHSRLCDSADNDCPVRSTGNGVGSQSTSFSVWGRIGSSKNRLDVKDKYDPTINPSDYVENETKEDQEALAGGHGISRQGKRIISEDAGSKAMDSSAKPQSDTILNIRKPSQKAQRTLFVNGVPQKSNKKEALFSHFRKFGEVIDIYIPANSERAFVQFSRREEAEAALKAPDAVMGNRFVKLWWANRDSVPDDGTNSSSSVSVTPRGATAVPPHLSVTNKGKDNFQSAAKKSSLVHASDASLSAFDHSKPVGNLVQTSEASLPASDQSKPVITDGPKVVPPLQKKLESLEHLKEELRKKQEMLDQKRNDFRRKLDKLEKQATGLKGEVVADQAAKRHKVGIVADEAKATTPRSSDSGAAVASPCAEMMANKSKPMENFLFDGPKTNTAMMQQESMISKQPIRPLAPAGPPFLMNRYKLDNRPATFRIIPPLPTGFANVAVLKEHFSLYGDVSTVEVEDLDAGDSGDRSETSKNLSAWLTFTTRQAAERAFTNGKCWQGHNLQFKWLTSSNSSNASGGRENSTSASKGTSDADVQSAEKSVNIIAQEAAENSGRESGVEHMETSEDSQPNPIPITGEKESPKTESLEDELVVRPVQ